MAKKTNRGRKGAGDKGREVVTIVSTLQKENDQISAQTISRRYSCTPEHAKSLLNLVQLIMTENFYLGVYPEGEDEDRLTLISSSGARGRDLRLSPRETRALLAALKALDVNADDPLLARLTSSYLSADVDAAAVQEMFGAEKGHEVPAGVRTCAEARAAGKSLSFSYTKVGGGEATERLVTPLSIEMEEDKWYLKAFDHRRGGERRFRIDHMSSISIGEKIDAPVAAEGGDEKNPLVKITFTNTDFINYLWWPNLEIVSETDEATVAWIPYYGGDWLARQVAACGGSATTDNEEINEKARAYAAAQLAAFDN